MICTVLSDGKRNNVCKYDGEPLLELESDKEVMQLTSPLMRNHYADK